MYTTSFLVYTNARIEKCKLRKITLSLNKNYMDRRYNAVVIVKLKKRLLFGRLEFNFANFKDFKTFKDYSAVERHLYKMEKFPYLNF